MWLAAHRGGGEVLPILKNTMGQVFWQQLNISQAAMEEARSWRGDFPCSHQGILSGERLHDSETEEELVLADTKEMRILTIGAHAADQELAAGMIIAKYTAAGHKAFVLSLTPGEKGHATLSAEEYAEQKKREATECCRKLGAEAIFLNYKDAELPYNDEVSYEVCDVIREIKPDVIITHWENSMHRDHRHAHKIAMDAYFFAALKRIEREKPAHWTRRVYFSENWEDMEGYEPDVYVNIPEQIFEQYCDALSSFALWNGGTGWPYADYYKSLARMRGCLGGGMNWKYAASLKVPRGGLTQRFAAERLPLEL